MEPLTVLPCLHGFGQHENWFFLPSLFPFPRRIAARNYALDNSPFLGFGAHRDSSLMRVGFFTFFGVFSFCTSGGWRPVRQAMPPTLAGVAFLVFKNGPSWSSVAALEP